MKNFLKDKLASGQTALGIWNLIPSAVLTEIIATAGFDFQIFDMEHGLYDFGTLDSAIRASESVGCSPVVRIGDLDLVSSQKALDMGAHGILFPQIKNSSDSQKAVEICNYPPIGVRGFNPFTRANAFGFQDSASIKRDTKDFSMTGVIVENISGQQNLDSILDTRGLDFVYLGAYDMSVSLGKPGNMENPELVNFLKTSVKKIRDQGKVAGVMAKNPAEVGMYTKLGANLILVGVDSFLIGQGLRNHYKDLSTSVQQ